MYFAKRNTGVLDLLSGDALNVDAQNAEVREEGHITSRLEGHNALFVVQKNLSVCVEFRIELSGVDLSLVVSQPLEEFLKTCGTRYVKSNGLQINGSTTI